MEGDVPALKETCDRFTCTPYVVMPQPIENL